MCTYFSGMNKYDFVDAFNMFPLYWNRYFEYEKD